MEITVLECPKSKFGPFHLVYDLVNWPAGTRKSRGWNNARFIYNRPATAREKQDALSAWRYMCYRYKDWESLKRDELLFGIDADKCRDRWASSGGRLTMDLIAADPAAHSAALATRLTELRQRA